MIVKQSTAAAAAAAVSSAQELVNRAFELSPVTGAFVTEFDILDLPCVIFAGHDSRATSAVASHWVRKSGPSFQAKEDNRDENNSTFKWWKFPHRSSIGYIEADMATGNPNERAIFVDYIVETFSLPHATQGKHVILLHNIDSLPTRSLTAINDTMRPHGRLVATTSLFSSLPMSIKSRAMVLRVGSDDPPHQGVMLCIDYLMKSKGKAIDCREFAHDVMKMSYPTQHVFRMMLRLCGTDSRMIQMAAELDHASRVITVTPHAIELFASEVYDHVKAINKKVACDRDKQKIVSKISQIRLDISECMRVRDIE
jgi:hypothetical protein